MAAVGVAVAILGGLVAMIAGLGASNWGEIGIGVGIIGLAFVLGDSVLGGRREPEDDPGADDPAAADDVPGPALHVVSGDDPPDA